MLGEETLKLSSSEKIREGEEELRRGGRAERKRRLRRRIVV